jgi:2-hydroxy-3-oxopropionate reductase
VSTRLGSPTGGQRVGFVGMGVMGLPMAQNLVKAGLDVVVFDQSAAALARAELAGLRISRDLGELVSGSDILLAMLPDTPQVDDIVAAADGILAKGSSDLIFVDMSTISPIGAVRIHKALAESNIQMLDAPVSGGHQKAIGGELSIMVGGDSAVVELVAPIFAAMGSYTYMGDAGAGQATKACNQVAVSLTIQAAIEAFTLGAKLGLDLSRLREALLGGSCASWILENMGPLILAGDDDPGFRIALQVKDLRIASEAAFSTATHLPGLSTILGLYTDAIAHGQLEAGNQSLSRVYERMTGATIGARPYSAAAD